MASPSTNVAQAKLRKAVADAAVAAAELKAARASALVAEAELEMAEALKDCNTSAPWFNVETPNALSSSPACGPARSGNMSTQDMQLVVKAQETHDNPWLDMVSDSGPSAAEGSTWGEKIASTLSASAAVAGKSACRAGPVASGSEETDQAGPFLQFGRRLRLRSWCVCRGGHPGRKCNSITTDPQWVPVWYQEKRLCFRFDCRTQYKMKFGMIVELNIDGRSFFVKSDCYEWQDYELLANMNKLSEKSTIAASTVRDYLDALQPMTFAQVFRMCQASENKPGVSAEQSFTLSGGMRQWTSYKRGRGTS